jgi:hypothetical protein
MARTFEDPNPHISILDDGATKKQIANLARHALEVADRMKTAGPPSEEQAKRERFAAMSNRLAEENSLYAAARGSTNFLVLPLEPNGTKPLVELSEATRDDRVLYEWWQTWPSANPGILLGRVGGVFAVQVDNLAAWAQFRELARYETYDEDIDRTWIHWREIGVASVRLLPPPSEPVSIRSRMGWGRQFTRAVVAEDREQRAKIPQTFWLLYGYHSVVSGQDCFDFKRRTVLPGVTVLGENDVLPFDGAVLNGGERVVGPGGITPTECPLWLAAKLGRARSRKVMEAARQQYEATVRMLNPHAEGNARAQMEATERAREEAQAEYERATRILEEAEGR